MMMTGRSGWLHVGGVGGAGGGGIALVWVGRGGRPPEPRRASSSGLSIFAGGSGGAAGQGAQEVPGGEKREKARQTARQPAARQAGKPAGSLPSPPDATQRACCLSLRLLCVRPHPSAPGRAGARAAARRLPAAGQQKPVRCSSSCSPGRVWAAAACHGCSQVLPGRWQ